MAFKKFMPEVRFNGEKIDADEMNIYQQYMIACPGTAIDALGTAAGGSNTQSKTFVMLNQHVDYPRTLLFTITNTAGSLNCGSVVVTGKDQWGAAQTETIGLVLGTQVQSNSGTKIFSSVSAATATYGANQLNNGTGMLGYASGTTAGSNVFSFGLPWRLAAKTDVKGITYAKNFVPAVLNAGTPTDLVTVDPPQFTGTVALGTADFFTVTALPSYNGENTEQFK